VQTDDGSVYYVAGLGAWDDRHAMRRVSVRGVLRERPPEVPSGDAEGEQSTGLADETLVLDEASWSLAGE
jgi:hypothetical protein